MSVKTLLDSVQDVARLKDESEFESIIKNTSIPWPLRLSWLENAHCVLRTISKMCSKKCSVACVCLSVSVLFML